MADIRVLNMQLTFKEFSRTIVIFSRTENYFYFNFENEAANTHKGGVLRKNCQNNVPICTLCFSLTLSNS